MPWKRIIAALLLTATCGLAQTDVAAGRKYVEEKDAKLAQVSSIPFTKARSLTRYWETLRDKKAEAAERFLRQYASSKNAMEA